MNLIPITVRITQKQNQQLNLYCKKHGYKKQSVIQQAITDKLKT